MFLYSLWLKLDLPTRNRIANELGIVKKGSTHVSDNRVVSDGYAIEDVEKGLDITNLQKVLQVNITDVAILWDILIHSTPVEGEVPPLQVTVAEEQPKQDVKKTKQVKRRNIK